MHSRYNRQVVEQAAILSVLNRDIFGDPQKAVAAVPYIAKRLDALSEETERGWQGQFTEGEGFQFERTVRGVKEVAVIDQALLGSADARKLDEFAPVAAEGFPAADAAGDAAAQGRRNRRSTARSACSRRSPPPAARAWRCSATKASAR